MNHLINQTKWGDCSLCPKLNLACVKIGKELVCMNCNQVLKMEKSQAKVLLKNKTRGGLKYQQEEELVDSIAELTIDLDRVVSRYVRSRAVDLDGLVECYTCGVRRNMEQMQAGHFMSRKYLSLRWDTTNNIKPQCGYCNVCLSGNLKVYAENLELEHPGIVEWLIAEARVVENTTRTELKTMLSNFQQKLKIVEFKIK